jgi:exodeoxyribonuclease VII large subunit
MHIMTVTAFVQYLNETFRAIWDAQQVAIEGEVTGYRLSAGQWVNFDLKDDQALVSVFLPAAKCSLPLQDGMRLRVFGWPRLYPKYGKFSLNAERLELVGEGALQKALLLLRQKLEAEGLFDTARKRVLPRFPKRIALIASRESAAFGDFMRILNERWSGLEIDLYHVLVQGDQAPPQIVAAVARAQKEHVKNPYDALILTRGGGSLEELMVFNDERVVRALFGSKVPTLVGIGHERDLTFAEEVADVRGSTPTDCARRLVPDKIDVLYEIAQAEQRILERFQASLLYYRQKIDAVIVRADHWLSGLHLRLEHLTRLNDRLMSLKRLLESYNPRAVLERGYALIYDAEGRPCADRARLAKTSSITIELRDGKIDATIQTSSGQPSLL